MKVLESTFMPNNNLSPKLFRYKCQAILFKILESQCKLQ